MKRLIVNADDFGSHELMNSAVEDAFKNGICRSASIMAGGKAFDNAVQIAKSNKDLDIGIHFTLVKGAAPVLNPSEIKSLVDETGNFHENFSIFVKRYLTGRINFDEVKAELTAQADKICSSGLNISHVDSHQHLHVLPKIFSIVADLSLNLGIKAMRIPLVNQFTFSPSRAALKFLASNARRRAEKLGFAIPDNFIGLVGGGSVSEEWLCKILDSIPEGTTELMIHPGTDNAELQKAANWEHDFVSELEAVKSGIIIDKLRLLKIESSSFAMLMNL